MKIYTTIQGDTWDIIAYRAMGDTNYTNRIVNANQEYRDIFFFPAGIKLTVPEVEEKSNTNLPPWKR